MAASGSRRETTSESGWDCRLYWQWIAYNTVAFVIVLTAGFLLALLGTTRSTWKSPAATS